MKYIKEFFRNDHPFIPFKEFGFIHCLCILLVIITLIIIYLNRNKISAMKDKTKKIILKGTAILMLINMIIYNIAPHLFGYFDYKMPFQLCFIAGYMFMYGILFEKEWILKLTLFLSFIGPIPAILWPDMPSTFDDFNFWKYFISHHIFICASFFSYYALNYRITIKDIIKAFIFTNCLVLIMMPFNYAFISIQAKSLLILEIFIHSFLIFLHF